MNHAKILPGHFRGLPTIRMRHNRASNAIADILLEEETIGDLVDGLPVIDMDAEPYVGDGQDFLTLD